MTHGNTHSALLLAAEAEELCGLLPPLLANINRPTAHRRHGAHKQKRSGDGQEFWQFRKAVDGDSVRMIDWKRSARSDSWFVREKEWQLAESILFWVDRSNAMEFSGSENRKSKAQRARVLALAMAILVTRSEELVGLLGGAPASTGRRKIKTLAVELLASDDTEYGFLPRIGSTCCGKVVLFSDFLMSMDHIESFMRGMASSGTDGVVVRILDPLEVEFPFVGGTEFCSIGGGERLDVSNASALQSTYLRNLRERWQAITSIANQIGWKALDHSTGRPAIEALVALADSMRAQN